MSTRKLTICVAIIICFMAATMSYNPTSSASTGAGVKLEIFEAWADFVKTFGKTYSSDEEKLARFQAFAKNYESIASHNENYQRGVHQYSKSINQFSDMVNFNFKNLIQINEVSETRLNIF